TKEAHLQDVLDTLFNHTFFIYLGAVIPWGQLAGSAELATPGRLAACALLIILFRRLPATMAVTRVTPAIHTFRESVFAGWFGPIGVGAVFYAMVAHQELQHSAYDGLRAKEYLLPIVYSLVTASVIVHGITIPLYHIVSASLLPLSARILRSASPSPSFDFRRAIHRSRLYREYVSDDDAGAGIGGSQSDTAAERSPLVGARKAKHMRRPANYGSANPAAA
ncbi:Na+/H+ antiporter, partial [Coemansia spiralis]